MCQTDQGENFLFHFLASFAPQLVFPGLASLANSRNPSSQLDSSRWGFFLRLPVLSTPEREEAPGLGPSKVGIIC